MTRGRPLVALLGATAMGILAVVAVACRVDAPGEDVNVKGTPNRGGATSGGTPTNVAPGFDKRALLASIAECTVGRYRAFEAVARELDVAARAWAGSPADDGLRTRTQAAYARAMDAWQRAEMFRFGPASASPRPGAKDLRDQIYAWPLFNRCKIDETTVDGSYGAGAFPTSLISARGLGAIEYLAFHGGTDNACSSFSPITANGTWAALGPAGLRGRKAAYTAAAAADVLSRATALVRAWEPASGDFQKELVTAGSGSRVFATNQDAFNTINDALFYVEVEVKDLKLARPLGLVECGHGSCASTVESPWARRSKENIAANLEGFRDVFQGCGEGHAGVSFDDWLRAAGAGDLADRMLAATTGAEQAIVAVGPSLEDALAARPAEVAAAHAAVKRLTDLLKTEFISVLNLELPKTTEGDND